MTTTMITPAKNGEITKDAAAPSCESELKEVRLAWRSAKRKFRDTVHGAIKDLQACGNDLSSQRTKSLERLHCEHPQDADELGQNYMIPSLMNGVYVCGDFVFSYRPKESLSNLLCDQESTSQEATSGTGQPVSAASPILKRKREAYHDNSSIAGTPRELPKSVNAKNYKSFLADMTSDHYLAMAFMMMEEGEKITAGKAAIDLGNSDNF